MIKLLLAEIKDEYIRENFKRILEHLNKEATVIAHPNYTDTNRPVAGLIKGDMIFNTNDNQLNIWGGSNWTLPDGSAT